jgi:hypothetical protein
VAPDELAPPLDELELLEEELLLEDELLDEELLLLEDELLDEELLELEDDDVLELLPDDPPPHPARTAASSKVPTSGVRASLEQQCARCSAASGLACSRSEMTDVDMVRAPIKDSVALPQDTLMATAGLVAGAGTSRVIDPAAAKDVLSPGRSRRNSVLLWGKAQTAPEMPHWR